MHPRAEEFSRAASDRYGFEPDVNEFPEGTKTAADAAEAIGCDVAQIASSIVVDTGDGLAVVVTSGANRVDTSAVADLLAVDDVSMADATDVKEIIGWSIGGVPPFCHASDVPVLLDETLLSFEEVWAAAGTPEAVFPLTPDQLRELSDGMVADVKEL